MYLHSLSHRMARPICVAGHACPPGRARGVWGACCNGCRLPSWCCGGSDGTGWTGCVCLRFVACSYTVHSLRTVQLHSNRTHRSLQAMSLTSRQLEILNFIQEWIRERGFPPSHGDLADHFRFNRNAAREHLLALARKGELELDRKSNTSELQSLMRISY